MFVYRFKPSETLYRLCSDGLDEIANRFVNVNIDGDMNDCLRMALDISAKPFYSADNGNIFIHIV